MTYPLSLPQNAPYSLSTAQTCMALVNVAIDMINQWQTVTNPPDPPQTWGWKPYDSCRAAANSDPSNPWYTLDVLTMVKPLTEADILNATFKTELGKISKERNAQNEPFGFIATSQDGQSGYLIFHGSVTKADWAADAMYSLTPYTAPDGTTQGNVETGFYTVFNGLATLIQQLDGLKNVKTLYVSGHSLGAAVATLCLPTVLWYLPGLEPANVFCYLTGSPMVGDQGFANYIQGLGVQFFRTVNLNDPVPKAPSQLLGDYVAIAPDNVATFQPPSYGGKDESNNHQPCCSYSYALFNSLNTQNPNFTTCQTAAGSSVWPSTTS